VPFHRRGGMITDSRPPEPVAPRRLEATAGDKRITLRDGQNRVRDRRRSPVAPPCRLHDENSRAKFQNVPGDSSTRIHGCTVFIQHNIHGCTVYRGPQPPSNDLRAVKRKTDRRRRPAPLARAAPRGCSSATRSETSPAEAVRFSFHDEPTLAACPHGSDSVQSHRTSGRYSNKI
jgi:hypothetical protein